MPAAMAASPVDAWLAEDGVGQDITSRSIIPQGTEGVAEIVAKQRLVAAGGSSAVEVLQAEDIEVDLQVEDGEHVDEGDVLIQARGPARTLLARERTAVNVLAHLSGIATRTAAIVERVAEANPSCQVLGTRKTTPGLRELEHAAIEAGGARPHRRDLSSAILVKENHLSFVTIEEAIEAADANAPGTPLVIEAETHEEARAIARSGVDGVLLDNVDPEELEDLVELLKRLAPSLTVEASGGITLDNVQAYARHVDRVSLGSITHSAPAVDISMRVHPA